jgi:putative tricarboxylic transport membrane protein
VEVRHNRDLWAGVMLCAIGAVALVVARAYAPGTVLRMGPGYFPRALGGILVLLGMVIALAGWRGGARIEGGWPLRPLILVPLAMVLFGFLVERAGFVPALVVLVVGSAAAGRELRLKEVVLLTVALTALSVAVFVWGLRLPYPLFKGF